MGDKTEFYNFCLDRLCKQTSSKERRTVIETLLTIYRNLLHKDDKKYKEIKLSNPCFEQKVWRHHEARYFMLCAGWKTALSDDWNAEGSKLVFKGDVCLKTIIDILLEYRDVVPKEDEWVEDGKYEGKSEEQIRNELREAELRRKAIQERDKELQAVLKDKRERKELANNIKTEIQSDRRKHRVFTKPERGNQLHPGASVVRTLHSLSSP